MTRLLLGFSKKEDIDIFIEDWHKSDSDMSLHEYLGMTEIEYGQWLVSDGYLDTLVQSRKREHS